MGVIQTAMVSNAPTGTRKGFVSMRWNGFLSAKRKPEKSSGKDKQRHAAKQDLVESFSAAKSHTATETGVSLQLLTGKLPTAPLC
jgi:hypothetical protein